MKQGQKYRAHQAVYRAMRKGKLVRKSCWCGEFGEAHHADYSKPLDIEWLCRKHHVELHKKEFLLKRAEGHDPGTSVYGIGEAHPGAILTEANVRDIRGLVGFVSVSALGRHYGVSIGAINSIIKRKTWKHIE